MKSDQNENWQKVVKMTFGQNENWSKKILVKTKIGEN